MSVNSGGPPSFDAGRFSAEAEMPPAFHRKGGSRRGLRAKKRSLR
jgi:hypothetical protein